MGRRGWLDRADCVQAAHLAERIRLAQSDDTRRQQAEAQAAEIGRRLLDGPPAPSFDLDRLRDRLERLAWNDRARQDVTVSMNDWLAVPPWPSSTVAVTQKLPT